MKIDRRKTDKEERVDKIGEERQIRREEKRRIRKRGNGGKQDGEIERGRESDRHNEYKECGE